MIESHKQSSVILRYEEEKTEEIRKIDGIYVRPLREVGWFEQKLEELKECDMIIGDLKDRKSVV